MDRQRLFFCEHVFFRLWRGGCQDVSLCPVRPREGKGNSRVYCNGFLKMPKVMSSYCGSKGFKNYLPKEQTLKITVTGKTILSPLNISSVTSWSGKCYRESSKKFIQETFECLLMWKFCVRRVPHLRSHWSKCQPLGVGVGFCFLFQLKWMWVYILHICDSIYDEA